MAVESRMWTWSLAQLLGASEAGVRLLVGQLMGEREVKLRPKE